MRVIFMGTPDFAVPSLHVLVREGYDVAAVVTQPDRPKGRKRELTPPPVKTEAIKYGIPVLQPEKMRDPAAAAELTALRPDLIVTAAYGQILPKAVLALPRLGCINVHASLLPKYRGGAPIHHAIINGERATGVTIMYMAEGLDTGGMISRVEVEIAPEDTTGTMFVKLSVAGAELLKKTLPALIAGEIAAVPQNEAEATYAYNIKREDENIDWKKSALQLFNQVRGLHPFPGAFTFWNGDVFKIWRCLNPQTHSRKLAPTPGQVPGTVLQMREEGIEVLTGDGTLWLTEIQPAGKKAMEVREFLRGAKMTPGTVLGG